MDKTFFEYTEQELEILKKQLAEKKQDLRDINSQIKEIDLNFNELLDIQIRKRKKELKALRHDLMNEQYINAMAIAELERTIYQKGYYVKEVEQNADR